MRTYVYIHGGIIMSVKDKKEIQAIKNILRNDYKNFANCSEIAEHINKIYNKNLSRRVVGNINTGKSYREPDQEYPIAKKFARGYLKNVKCSVCEKQAKTTWEEKPYCLRHYNQLYRNGEVLDYTIYEKNDLIEGKGYFEVILRDVKGNETGKSKIDSDDFERVSKYKWYKTSVNDKEYCQGTLEMGVKIRLHHFVLNINGKDLNGKVIDHINGDSLDNRKKNLRIVSQKVNMENINPHDKSKGIEDYKLKSGKTRYRARITHNYRTISLGTYDTFEEAYQARKNGEKKYYKS